MGKPNPSLLTLRPAVDPAAQAAFLRGEPVPARAAFPAPTGRRVHERKDGRQVRRTTILMQLELARRLDLYAAQHGIDKTAVLHAALEQWLSKRGA